jgi:hypothetical protein
MPECGQAVDIGHPRTWAPNVGLADRGRATAEATVDGTSPGKRDDVERALDLLFGANRPDTLTGDDWRREVRETFRRRALDAHPDRSRALGRSEASLAEEFRALFAAYRLLSRDGSGSTPFPSARPSSPDEPGSGPATSPAPGRPSPPVPDPARAAPAEPRRSGRAPQDHVHKAPLPHRPLLFAEYLYYSGRASWRNLVEAVAWQRRQRPALGRIAVEWGHLSDEEVRAILDERRRDGAAGEPFGAYARRKGFLTGAQLLALLGRQRRQQRRIGEFFVESGILREAEVLALDDDLARHNARWRRSA